MNFRSGTTHFNLVQLCLRLLVTHACVCSQKGLINSHQRPIFEWRSAVAHILSICTTLFSAAGDTCTRQKSLILCQKRPTFTWCSAIKQLTVSMCNCVSSCSLHLPVSKEPHDVSKETHVYVKVCSNTTHVNYVQLFEKLQVPVRVPKRASLCVNRDAYVMMFRINTAHVDHVQQFLLIIRACIKRTSSCVLRDVHLRGVMQFCSSTSQTSHVQKEPSFAESARYCTYLRKSPVIVVLFPHIL